MTDPTRGQLFLEDLSSIKEDLPYSPELLRDLFTMTSEESLTSLDQVGEVVGKDPNLAAKVLSMANSAYYGLQAKVTSVPRAITVLGMTEMRNLVLLLGMEALSTRHTLPSGFDMQAFWRHQLAVAVVARLLAERQPDTDADLLFTAGLLHDFGKLLIALHRPNDWLVIDAMMRHAHLAFSQAEEAHWGIEHGMVGAMVLNSWDLPPELTEPINWHHAPELSPEHASEAGLLFLANAATNAVTRPDSPQARPWEASFAELGLDFDELMPLIQATLADESIYQLISHFC